MAVRSQHLGQQLSFPAVESRGENPIQTFPNFRTGAPEQEKKQVFANEDTERNRHLCNIEKTPIETTCVDPTKHRNTWVKKDTEARYFPGNLVCFTSRASGSLVMDSGDRLGGATTSS